MNDDKVYRDVRVFRFRVVLLKQPGRSVEFRTDGPVPIYNEADKLIGFASVGDLGSHGVADCAIDPATPERMDLEIDTRTYWMDALLEFRGFISNVPTGFKPTIAYVRGLIMTTQQVAGQEPIDPVLGSLR